MRCGQVHDVLYEEVELALFLLDGNIELHMMAAKGGEKGSNFSPPTMATIAPFHFDDLMHHRHLHPP
jgi:hypothetical protein